MKQNSKQNTLQLSPLYPMTCMSVDPCKFAVTLNIWRPSPPVQKLLSWFLSKKQRSTILLILLCETRRKVAYMGYIWHI